MNSKSKWLVSLLAVALLALASAAKATTLPPGGSANSSLAVTTGTLTLVDTASGTFTGALTGTPTGSWSERVYTDNGIGGGLCAGCLDFLINVTVATGEVARITAQGFQWPTITNVGFISSSTNLTHFAPFSVDRSTSGSDNGATIGFNYPNLSGNTPPGPNYALQPGQSTATLVIETNSLTYTSGFLSIIDGGTATNPAFGVTPEPAIAILLPLSLLTGGVFRKKLFA